MVLGIVGGALNYRWVNGQVASQTPEVEREIDTAVDQTDEEAFDLPSVPEVEQN